MAFYEIVFIMRADLSPEAADAIAEGYGEVLQEKGGKVESKESWGIVPLAYPIKKNKRGHFFMIQISASHEALLELERKMRLDEDNLRVLTTRIDEINKDISVFVRRKQEEEKEMAEQSERVVSS